MPRKTRHKNAEQAALRAKLCRLRVERLELKLIRERLETVELRRKAGRMRAVKAALLAQSASVLPEPYDAQAWQDHWLEPIEDEAKRG